VFLLLLCNDRAVLGPWVNGRRLNLFTSAVIALLVMLSVVLTASVVFPHVGTTAILSILGGGTALTVLGGLAFGVYRRLHPRSSTESSRPDPAERATWRMPPLNVLARPRLSTGRRLGLTVLRGYLVLAVGMVVVRVVQLAVGHQP
jgi:hypothetical protein